MKIRHLVQLCRPAHWVKNTFVLFPLFFALRFTDGREWVLALLAAAGFCLIASAAYVLNDLQDRQRDRLHPRKKDRPLASGAVTVGEALTLEGVLLVGAVLLGWLAGLPTLLILLAYFLLQIVYSLWLKHKMIADVICVALGFVLRALAGAVAIRVVASPWLIICTFTLCLFMGFCKRRAEVATLGDENRHEHRPTLAGYSQELLTHLITLSAVLTIISYLLYASHPDTVAKFHTDYMVYTLPIIVYAVCRFAMLSMVGFYADPTDLVLRDRAFQLACVLWAGACLVIIKWGPQMRDWIGGG